ncbi:GIY-YIG nuclease family protein, partial [Staphylococcus rostri]|uniref:GIY-YIG nuclease family protein n=1 Tax=Staphylococcus rostri TaxID=522262 RepID=UPI001F0C7AD0
KINKLESQIEELNSSKSDIHERKINSKSGYVYIISNIGSFGENVYKIGVTRRLEPMERIKELSDASVPFEFDVHAIIFSDNAFELENKLHKHFKQNQINKVNNRKEFYNVDLSEIQKLVLAEYNDTVEFTFEPKATQYRESLLLS